MSSLATSSPVSASTLEYLMRWPVLRLIWLKETFSDSEVAGKSATGQVTSDRRKKPFQLARGAIRKTPIRADWIQDVWMRPVPTSRRFGLRFILNGIGYASGICALRLDSTERKKNTRTA